MAVRLVEKLAVSMADKMDEKWAVCLVGSRVASKAFLTVVYLVYPLADLMVGCLVENLVVRLDESLVGLKVVKLVVEMAVALEH